MRTHCEEAIAEAASWLKHESQHIQFGAAGVTLILHAGRIVRVDHTSVERTQTASDQHDLEDQR